MLCLKSMAMGESVDAQRNARWPGQTSQTEAKVIWDVYQQDELREGTEDLMPGAGDVDMNSDEDPYSPDREWE